MLPQARLCRTCNWRVWSLHRQVSKP
jgi:hypothetical protein